jgi:hypothetical protein
MANPLVCWKCGATLTGVPLPLRQQALCPQCSAYLHACRMCLHFSRGLPKACTEQDAEEVLAKDRANFCDYFKPNPNAHGKGARKEAARGKLDTLFGQPKPDANHPNAAKNRLDELFGGTQKKDK